MTDTMEANELILTIAGQHARDAAHGFRQLYESEQRRADRLHATLALIHERMNELLNGRWMPTTSALLDAVYPDDEQIDERVAQIEAAR